MSIRSATPVKSLYVHVPFCAHKCEYCAFYSEASKGETIQRYVGALVLELGRVASELKTETIFFGGGTPSLLTLGQWETVLRTMELLNLLGASEWTVECNPATVSLEKARLWRSYGINRVSMGVQSLDESLLDGLGRVHSREMVFKSFDILRRGGFENINIDLMFGIPRQTMEVWRSTLDEAIGLGSEHLSSYEVIYEDDTPLYAQLQAGEFSVDEDLACAMYEELVSRTGGLGFAQYEISNFARRETGEPAGGIPRRACRHNVNYWRGGSYHGLGPSAAGYVHGVRTKNWSNTPLYCELLEVGKPPLESREQIPPLQRAGETAAFGFRMNDGWPFDQFTEATGYDLRKEWAGEISELVSQGWACVDPDRVYPTARGLRFADAVAEKFLR